MAEALAKNHSPSDKVGLWFQNRVLLHRRHSEDLHEAGAFAEFMVV